MPNVTATEARRYFGRILSDAQTDPVFISKDGKQSAVLLSFDALKVLLEKKSTGVNPKVERLVQELVVKRGSVLKALSKLG